MPGKHQASMLSWAFDFACPWSWKTQACLQVLLGFGALLNAVAYAFVKACGFCGRGSPADGQ